MRVNVKLATTRAKACIALQMIEQYNTQNSLKNVVSI